MTKAEPSSTPAPWQKRFLLFVALFVFAVAVYRIQMVAAWHLADPFDLTFESPNLATIQALRREANVYDAAFFNGRPFVFTMYTPLYHLICAHLPSSASNPFLTGRLVALAFMGMAALGIFHVCKPRDWTIALLWAGTFLLLHPVVSNLAFVKNDGTALFFSALALLTVSRNSRGPLRLVLTALLCVLAVAAKQVYVSATGACFVYLLLQRRSEAFRFALFWIVFAAIGGAAAQLVWGNGFWWCVFQAPRMPSDWNQFTAQWSAMLRQPMFLLLLVCSVATAVEYVARNGRRQISANPFLLYCLFSGAVLLLTVGKPGSSTNYFIEPSLAAAFWLVSIHGSSFLTKLDPAVVAAVCLAATVCELALARRGDFAFADPSSLASRAQLHDRLMKEAESLVGRTNDLRVLNLADAPTYFEWPGETSVNDPFLYMLLWRRNVLKPDGLVRELRSQAYDFVVLQSGVVVSGAERSDGTGQIAKALRESYRFAGYGDYLQYWVRIPSGPKN
jgi:hypothetical protein